MSEKGQRQNRFNSFELLTDDESNLSTTSLKNTIIELQQFFPETPLETKEVNDLVDDSISELDAEASEDNDGDTFRSIPIYNVKFLKQIRRTMSCTEILKSIRSLLEESRASDEIVNWDLIVKEGFKVDCYLSFIYVLMKLFDVDNKDKVNKDLAFNAGRTYLCLLGLPGAKRCLVWDPDLVIAFFKLLTFHTKLKSGDHYLEIQMIQMLNECKNVFNIVCLNDQEDVLEKYIETLSSVLENYLISNTHSAVEIVKCCYDNLESLCLRPLPDKDIENVMYLIFCRTVDLHFITPKRKVSSSKSKHGEAISDFFLYLLSAYSSKTKNVLLKFIKSVLSNPEHKFEREKFQKLMDVAVKYELAIYWKCNESIIEYLEKLSMSSDHRQRLNGVEFAGRMLLINTTLDTNTESMVNIKIPREVYVIKILFERINDKQDNVKLKALTSIKAAIVNGNEYTRKIFDQIFKKSTSSSDNPEILSILGEEAENFQQNLLAMLQTSSATYIKKTSLEILSHHCDNLLDDEIFIDIITTLTDDPSYLVKNQLLDMVNSIIKDHPKHVNALEMWLEVIMALIRDNDNKIVDSSVKSLTAIFQKIESFENTVNDAQILPWTIVKMILAKGKRGLLQSAIDAASSSFLTQEKLRKIETHIFTSNKTEAWCILSLIAKKMKSNNPDIVVKTFLDCISERNYDNNDFHLILEVIHNWIENFSVNSRSQIASKMTEVLENGDCPISMVAHLYEICKITRTSLKEDQKKFPSKLNLKSKNFILDNFETFSSGESSEKMLTFILIYCESNTDLPTQPDRKVIDLFFEFLRKILNNQLAVSLQNDIPRKLNIIIIVLTRFALRDAEMAAELTPDLAALLRRNINVSVITTAMQCLNDLCKKHTSTVAPVFKDIVYKLHSKCEEVRLCALANIYDLVMQDFIKMKGRVLLNLLACLVDKNEIIQLKSQAAILSYTNDKNPNLLYTCFLESVYLFNNFIQAENFGVFPLDEIDQNYLLLNGDGNRLQRRELYQFFVQNIHDINEIHLLMLLKHVNVLKEKFEKKKFRKSSSGTSTLKDLLYIFKLICEKRGESKIKMNKGEGAGNNDEYEADDGDAPQSSAAKETSTTTARGRKNKNSLTVNDAAPVVEKMIQIYPAFANFIVDYDNSLKDDVDELTKQIAINFASFIEYSKENFWNQVLKENASEGKKAKKKGRRSMKKVAADESDDDDNEDDIEDEDD